MKALLLVLIVVAAIALAEWLPKWRLRRAMQDHFPDELVGILEKNIPVYRRMTAHEQQQLQHLIKQFLHQKEFYGCGGLDITDEIRVTIAGLACLLLLNRLPRVYPELHSILVYPSAFVASSTEQDEGGVVTHTRESLLGESWGDGRVVLSWDDVQQGTQNFTDGHNVVLHEFAHQLDEESGRANGA